MIYSKVYLHLADTWLGYDGSALAELADWPACQGPTLTIDDFGTAPAGIHVLDGKPAYATAIIERRIRDQGLADGESHVVVHRRMGVTGGEQLLYSAVPVERWQQQQAWISRQDDHCMVAPLLGLLEQSLADECGVVACHGRQITILVRHDSRLIYLSGMAFSDSKEDLRAALAPLAVQLSEGLRGFRLKSMAWCSVYLADAAAQEDLARDFTDISGIPLTTSPSVILARTGRPDARIGVASLLEKFRPLRTINAVPDRLLSLAEMHLPWVVGACVVVAVGMFAAGISATVQAGMLESHTTEMARRAQTETEHATALMASLKAPAEYDRISSFADHLNDLSGSLNPYSVLADIRSAAGEQARILRVRYEHGRKQASAILVDGVLRDSTNVAQGISMIVTRLRQEGYEPTAIPPSEANPSPAFFSYRLVRREQQ